VDRRPLLPHLRLRPLRHLLNLPSSCAGSQEAQGVQSYSRG